MKEQTMVEVDSPASDAAEQWIKTKLGQATLRQCASGDASQSIIAVERAFRQGYIRGQHGGKLESVVGPLLAACEVLRSAGGKRRARTAGGWTRRMPLRRREMTVVESHYTPEPTEVVACIDCGLPYADFGLDLVLPDQQWIIIHPGINGVLCSNCICSRASKHSGTVVLAWIDNLTKEQQRREGSDEQVAHKGGKGADRSLEERRIRPQSRRGDCRGQ